VLYQLILFAAGLLLIIGAEWIEVRSKRQHAQRLDDLRTGGPERFFEERRSLEAYRPRRSWAHRLFGAALLVFAIASLALN